MPQPLTCVGVLSRWQRIRQGQGLLRLTNGSFNQLFVVYYQESNHACCFHTYCRAMPLVCCKVKLHLFSWNVWFVSKWQAIWSCVLECSLCSPKRLRRGMLVLALQNERAPVREKLVPSVERSWLQAMFFCKFVVLVTDSHTCWLAVK